MGEWQPIETCPDNASVLFYFHGAVVMGCMEHDTLRMGGYRKDHFWGGPWAWDADNQPPTHWMPLPDPPSTNPDDLCFQCKERVATIPVYRTQACAPCYEAWLEEQTNAKA